MVNRVALSLPRLFPLRPPLARQLPAKPTERGANRSLQKSFRLRRRSRAPATRPQEEPQGSAHPASFLQLRPLEAQAQAAAPQLEAEIPALRAAPRCWRRMWFHHPRQSAQALNPPAPAEKVPASVAPEIPAQFSLLPKRRKQRRFRYRPLVPTRLQGWNAGRRQRVTGHVAIRWRQAGPRRIRRRRKHRSREGPAAGRMEQAQAQARLEQAFVQIPTRTSVPEFLPRPAPEAQVTPPPVLPPFPASTFAAAAQRSSISPASERTAALPLLPIIPRQCRTKARPSPSSPPRAPRSVRFLRQAPRRQLHRLCGYFSRHGCDAICRS